MLAVLRVIHAGFVIGQVRQRLGHDLARGVVGDRQSEAGLPLAQRGDDRTDTALVEVHHPRHVLLPVSGPSAGHRTG